MHLFLLYRLCTLCYLIRIKPEFLHPSYFLCCLFIQLIARKIALKHTEVKMVMKNQENKYYGFIEPFCNTQMIVLGRGRIMVHHIPISVLRQPQPLASMSTH